MRCKNTLDGSFLLMDRGTLNIYTLKDFEYFKTLHKNISFKQPYSNV